MSSAFIFLISWVEGFLSPTDLSRERTDEAGAERKISSANLIASYALLLIVALNRVAVEIGKCSHVIRSTEYE